MPQVEAVANFDSLADVKSVLVTTFKKDGTAVASPVCHVVENGIVYATTLGNSNKVKRIRNDPRVTIGACSMSGKPTGPTYAARAWIVSDEEISRSSKLKKTGFVGAVFPWSAHAHWLVKPMQFYDRLRYGEQFIAIAFEPSSTVDLPAR